MSHLDARKRVNNPVLRASAHRAGISRGQGFFVYPIGGPIYLLLRE